MRTVDRSSVPPPAVLESTATTSQVANYAAASGPDKVNKHLYGHVTVVQALRQLYHEKCSLCEIKAPHDGVVEHFIPHHPDRAELAYDWNNLHWTCGTCNQRKKREQFKEFRVGSKKIVERTLLLNPTDPGVASIEEQLTFRFNDLVAQSTRAFSGSSLVQNTADFLNDPLLQIERLTRGYTMSRFVAECGCVPEWKELLTNGINVNARPDPSIAKEALKSADRLFVFYLHVTSEFCSSMRCVLADLGVSVEEIGTLGRAHRAMLGIGQLY